MTNKRATTSKAIEPTNEQAMEKLTDYERALLKDIEVSQGKYISPARIKCQDGIYKVSERTGNKVIDDNLFAAKLLRTWNTNDHNLANELHKQVINITHQFGENSESINAAISLIEQIQPRDGIEAMLVNQMVSIHLLTMESAKRAAIKGQVFEGEKLYLREVNKLARTFTAQIEALNKHRGKGQQKMKVEHVHVNEGGQAVIGSVDSENRQQTKLKGDANKK